ncbi:MAG: hypothetical protein ACTHMS_09430 [Jatrophihabitans sp.]|uniref:hypothetical protein n=1 Tax=Jatrophihabitans sp. TaxID=1932789 RepID=UPI003F7EDF61
MTAARRTGAVFQLYQGAPGAPVHWRLLSGNNREAGRSGAGHLDATACRIAIKELQRDLDLLRVQSVRVDSQRWTWEVLRGGELLALAGHSFDRAIRCQQGAARFLDLVRVSEVAPEVLSNGLRRWGTSA